MKSSLIHQIGRPTARLGWFSHMRSQLIATFLVVILLGVGLVGSYSLPQYRAALHDRVDSESVARSQAVAQETEMTLAEARGDLFLAANVPPVQGIVRARDNGGYDQEDQSTYDVWEDRLQRIYTAMTVAYSRYLQIRYLDENGNEMVRVDWDGRQTRVAPRAELQNKADRSYFQATMKLRDGQVYISAVDLNREAGRIVLPYQPTIRLATPIFNRQGQRRGIVILNVAAQTLLHHPGVLSPDQNAFFFIADQRGYYLHHSASPEKEWGGPEDLNTGYSLQTDFPQAAGPLLSGQTGDAYAGDWEIFYRPISIDKEHGVFLVSGLAVPINAIEAAVNRSLGVFIAVLVFSWLLAIGIGSYLSRRITSPLESLRQGARQIAGSNFDQRVPVAGSVEVADLADDFNRMASQLQELYNSQQAEYQRLFESASDSIFIHDLNNRFLAINENAARRLGYTRDELLQMTVQELDTPEAAARVAAHVRLLLEQGSLVIESAHRRKDGSAMPVEISASLVKYRGQQAVMSFVRDISERQRTKAALQAREHKYRHLFENASVGMYRSRLDGSAILEVNQHLCEIFGYSRAEMLASPATIHWANPAQRAEMVRLVQEQGTLTDYEADIVTKGGEIKTCLTSIRLYPEEGCLEGTAIDITDRRHAEAEIARRNAALAAQNAIAATISQSLDLDAILGATLDEMLTLQAMEAGGIYLSEDSGQKLTLAAHRGLSEEFRQAMQHIRMGEGSVGRAMAEQRLIILDAADHPAGPSIPAVAQARLHSAVAVPIVARGVVLGTLMLGTRHPRAFPPHEQELLIAIGQQIGVAVENARLYEQVKEQRAEEQAALLRLSQGLLAAAEVQAVMDLAVQVVAEVLRVPMVALMLPEQKTQPTHMVLRAAIGGQPEQIGVFRLPIGPDSGAGYAFSTGQPLIIEDLATETRFRPDGIAHRVGAQAGLVVPMQIGDRVIGALSVAHQTPRSLNENDLHLLWLIANQTAIALERTRLFEETRRRASELQAIAEVGGLVTTGGDLQATLETLAQKITRAAGLAAVGIGLYDAAQQTLVYPTLYSTVAVDLLGERRGTRISLAEAPVLQYLLREKKHLLLDDPQNDPRMRLRQRELCRRDGVQAVLAMPLLFQQELVGVLDLISTRRGVFSPETIALLTTLADQVAIAIHNARLYSQIEQRARELNSEVIQQKQRAETVLRSISDGVYTVDCDLHVLSWSQGAEAITGYTAADVLGRPCADFLRHQDEHGEVLCGTDHCPFTRVWSSGKAVGPDPVFAHHKDGHLLPVSVTAAPIVDEEGFAASAVEVFRDVTRERELVENLRAASRAKTRFLANMSHELRTPLNGVLGISQALLQGVYGDLNPKQAARLGNVYESGQHLLRLINDLLDLARVEEERLTLAYQPIAVADLCQAALQMIQPVADAKQLRLTLDLGPGPARIEGDERRLRQVLLNLLSNAVKFTPAQGRIGLTAAGKAGGVEFIVWDTGIGIPAERQAFLFQPFSQVDDDLARRYQGSGLGLALVKQLTELHGGWVTVASAPGVGSRFRVWLPVKRADKTSEVSVTPDVSRTPPAAGAQPSAGSPPRRVLIVDDNSQVAQLVQDILENAGYAVVHAADGAAGLQAARAQAPDLILMDMQLPGLDGLEITRRLKADPTTRAIPVVALTASAMPDERARALATGLDDYLTKPIDITVLTGAVEQWTRRSA
jgi:PAS domain S-box-containing protein